MYLPSNMCFQNIGIFQRFGETWAIINLQDKSKVGFTIIFHFIIFVCIFQQFPQLFCEKTNYQSKLGS